MAAVERQELVDRINELITMDRSGGAAYVAAAKKSDDRNIADMLLGFSQDHERRVRDLEQVVTDMGADLEVREPVGGKLPRSAKQVKKLSGMRQLLQGVRANEVVTNEVYARYVEAEGVDGDLKRLLQRSYEDAQRHLSWIDEQLPRFQT